MQILKERNKIENFPVKEVFFVGIERLPQLHNSMKDRKARKGQEGEESTKKT